MQRLIVESQIKEWVPPFIVRSGQSSRAALQWLARHMRLLLARGLGDSLLRYATAQHFVLISSFFPRRIPVMISHFGFVSMQ